MKTRRVLIVDDAPEFARLIKDALSTMPYSLETRVILSGEEAWLEASKTRYDLVITDLRLPGIPGTELVRRLRARYPDIGIIAISGLEEAGLNERTRAAGADAFYRKPLELPSLLTKIDNLLFTNEPADDDTYPQSGHPSKIDPTDPRVVPIEIESEKVDTGKLDISPLPREKVDAFWNEIDSTKSNSGFSPGTISFDQATSMGIVPENDT